MAIPEREDTNLIDKLKGKAKSQIQQTAAGAAIVAPSLFEQTLPGLFGGRAAVEFEETFFDRFKRIKFGGIFGPSKAERAAFEREQVAERAALNRRTQGIAGQLRAAGRGDTLQFPAVRRAVEAAALGEEQGLADVASLFTAQTEAQRAAGVRRQAVSDLTAEETLAAAQLEREGGPFGSFLDRSQFTELENKVGTQMAGASRLFNIADIVENLSDADIALIGSGSGGEITGQIEADLFILMQSMQTLLEQKPSVLREADQKLIKAALGDPSSLIQNLFSREAKTLAMIRRFGDALVEDAGRSLSSMDPKTLALLGGVNKLTPSQFERPGGPTVAPGISERAKLRARADAAAASIPSAATIRTGLSGPRAGILEDIESFISGAPGQLADELEDIAEKFRRQREERGK